FKFSSRPHPRKFGLKRFLAVSRSWRGSGVASFWLTSFRKKFIGGEPDHGRDPLSKAQAPHNPAGGAAQRHRLLLRFGPLAHCKTCYTSSVILGLGVSPMRRREFIALLGSGVAAWPFSARAEQPPTTVRRVGFLLPGGARTTAVRGQLDAFRQGLKEYGW